MSDSARPTGVRLKDALQHLPCATICSEPGTGRILGANSQARELLGLGPELRGLDERSLYVCPSERNAVAAGLRPGSSVERKVELRTLTGRSFTAMVSYRAVERRGRAALFSSFVPVDYQAAPPPVRLASSPGRARMLEAVGQLAVGIAHDVNNLLLVISSLAEVVHDETAADHPSRADLQEIVRAAGPAVSLARRLLKYSGRQAASRDVFDLGRCLRGVRRMLERLLAPAGVVLDMPEPGRELPVRMDPDELELLILNLAVNARDAMPEGGTLTIKLGSLEIGADAAPPLVSGSYVQVTIADTGCGMDDETLARAFETFFTTKAIGHGTGVGLPTCRAIVEQAGGRILASSSLGEGSRFEILLPLADEARSESSRAA